MIAPAIILGGLLIFWISSFIKDQLGAKFKLDEMRDRLEKEQKAFLSKAKRDEDEMKRMIREKKRKEWRS